MTTAQEFYNAGRLQAAIDAQSELVRSNPTDLKKRMFLFEMLAFAGQWERASKQLAMMDTPDQSVVLTITNYRFCLEGEDHRRKVFQENKLPNFFVEPPGWVYHRLEAIKLLNAGQAAAAKTLLEQCDSELTLPKLSWNNGAPQPIRDCDDLFGPVLEVISKGGYFWLPLEQLDGITANAPKAPRDLNWFPAKISVKNGPAGDAYLPALYPQSYLSDRDTIRLGRETDWSSAEASPVRGQGLRMLLVGDDAYHIPDLRTLIIPEMMHDPVVPGGRV